MEREAARWEEVRLAGDPGRETATVWFCQFDSSRDLIPLPLRRGDGGIKRLQRRNQSWITVYAKEVRETGGQRCAKKKKKETTKLINDKRLRRKLCKIFQKTCIPAFFPWFHLMFDGWHHTLRTFSSVVNIFFQRFCSGVQGRCL